MKITWFGHACFKIETDAAVIVTDPYEPRIGLTLPKDLKADIVTVSHSHGDHNNVAAVAGEPTVFSTAGTADAQGVAIDGVSAFHDEVSGAKRGTNILFRLETDGIVIAHMGDLGHVLTDDQVKALGHVDVLMVPVGGLYTVDAEVAVSVAEQLNPKIIVPMHHFVDGLVFPLATAEPFVEKMGLPAKKMDTLEIDAKSLPESPFVALLKPVQ